MQTPLPLAQAVALGVLHGPAELLPISSSAHVAIVPWLLGWRYSELDGELRKAFEVALHAGTAAALAISLGAESRRGAGRRRLLMALSSAPPAIAGYALERPIERRLGTPETIVVGLIAGGVAMALADRRPEARLEREAGPRDALWLGVAQAVALVPGVSRSGATLTAARLRLFTRADSARLSRQLALPVIAGATALKAVRVQRRGLEPGTGLPVAAGAAAAFCSTLGCARAIRHGERERSLLPYAAYRIALAAVVVAVALRRS